jgi:hypothetical protein
VAQPQEGAAIAKADSRFVSAGHGERRRNRLVSGTPSISDVFPYGMTDAELS